MRGRLFLLCSSLLLGSLAAETTNQRVVVRIDAFGVQQALDRETRSAWSGQPLLLTPQFEVVEPLSGIRAPLKVTGGLWVAELEIPAPPRVNQLLRLALVPLPSAGPDAVRAIARLQDQWSTADPYPLVRGVLAWAWGARDPRFAVKTQTLTLTFPLMR